MTPRRACLNCDADITDPDCRECTQGHPVLRHCSRHHQGYSGGWKVVDEEGRVLAVCGYTEKGFTVEHLHLADAMELFDEAFMHRDGMRERVSRRKRKGQEAQHWKQYLAIRRRLTLHSQQIAL